MLSARELGPEGFGQFMFAIAYVGLFGVLFEGGIDILTMRELAGGTVDANEFFSHTVLLKLMSSAVVGLIVTASIFVVGIPPAARVLIFITIMYNVANTVMIHFRFYFRAFEVMQYEAISIIVEKLSVLVFCGLSLYFTHNVSTFMVSYSMAYAFSALLTLGFLKGQISLPRWPFNMPYLWKEIVKPALPFALMGVFMVLYFRSSTIMIRALTGREELVGYYNAGYRLIEGFVLFPSIIVTPLYASFSKQRNDLKPLKPSIYSAARIILFVSVMIATPIFIFRKEFTTLLFGEQYTQATATVGTLVFAMIPIGVTWLFGSVVGAIGRQAKLNVFIAIISALNIVTNFIMITSYGIQGAVVTTLATEVAICVSCWWVVRDYFNEAHFWKLVTKISVPVCGVLLLDSIGTFRGSFIVQLERGLLGLVAAYGALGIIGMSDVKKILAR